MVVSSRPSLRSSSRLAEFPATVANKPSGSAEPVRRAKRTRNTSNYEDEAPPSKKIRTHTLGNNQVRHLPRNKLSTSAAATVHRASATGRDRPPDNLHSAKHLREHVSQSQQAAQIPKVNKQDEVQLKNPPQKPETRDEKRSLRSQGASRFKSDLSLYFPSYDEMISNEPKEPEFLTADTPIVIVDNLTNASGLDSRLSHITMENPHSRVQTQFSKLKHEDSLVDSSASKSILAQKIDFSSIEKHTGHIAEDPLTDDLYYKAHRRAERQEKQLRNIERERAQHEKQHLERLLEGLRGPDWLKVMGVTGITESEKKAYEPKRDMFIEEVGALVAKFKAWKEEEKRRKTERHQTTAVEEQPSKKEKSPSSSFEHRNGEETPDSSDVDAWAARQLHQEAISASGAPQTEHSATKKKEPPKVKKPTVQERPFTSFYSKPYLRAAAVGKHRRNRSRTAFGLPLPEVAEKEFGLPEHILTQEAKTSRARSRRRRIRGTKGN
ncbi:hypothetical protein L228DRAFT_242554 [Xylona heveae TC161]|uniref:Something about silencing protein 4 domain-containing protein n=1 Tax=Xylona heveae (strain CBS 132557 / TC161) TaxID=1328760 RepID=A0A165JEK2_XYLHT|nr:hypothetical protein L228DRAFT_242554 [Xylona heveae TC161]KZF26136.1 hypothetical protein L228DRAFT_242554 [Xylona heveae TC161]